MITPSLLVGCVNWRSRHLGVRELAAASFAVEGLPLGCPLGHADGPLRGRAVAAVATILLL